jgi:hypothetical protein
VEDTIIGLLKLRALPVPARSSSITAAQAIPIVMIAPTEAFGQSAARETTSAHNNLFYWKNAIKGFNMSWLFPKS